MALAPAPGRRRRGPRVLFVGDAGGVDQRGPEMMAVPCWSSWNTGMSISSLRRRSISKHSGAAMSSRLIPPKVGSIISMAPIIASVSSVSSSTSKTSMSAKRLNRTPFPSMTGLRPGRRCRPARAQRSRRRRPPTRLPLGRVTEGLFGVLVDVPTGSGDAGEYASERSRWVFVGLVVSMAIFPGGSAR